MPYGDLVLRGIQALYIRIRLNLRCTPEIKVLTDIAPRGILLPICDGDTYSYIAPVFEAEYIVVMMVTAEKIIIIFSQFNYTRLLSGGTLLADR